MANVKFVSVKKIYDKTVTAVDNFNLEIKDKEFVVFVGPSGCGKSTTLRMIAGLEHPSGGEIYIGEKLVNDVPPKDRDIAMVFQNYALYPHMTVYENIGYGLKLRKYPKAIIDEKVREAAQILDISDLLKRKPKALSGGQRQRVAIGRAIVREPQVFLMDEPLSNLDAKLRNQMRAEIIQLRRRIDTTFVYVTHDQTEAMTLGDRIVIMKDGIIQQVGTPQEVFAHPKNLFVAGFIGAPQMNFFSAELEKQDGRFCVKLGGFTIELSEEKQEALFAKDTQSQTITLGIRPEHLQLSANGLEATVGVSEMMGSAVHLHLRVLEQDVIAVVPNMDDSGRFNEEIPDGAVVHISFHGSAVHLFHPETGINLEYAERELPMPEPAVLLPQEKQEAEQTQAVPSDEGKEKRVKQKHWYSIGKKKENEKSARKGK